MQNVAVITGAGSGVGQAVALALAADKWNLALIGRRREALQETVKLAGKMSSNIHCWPCDIGYPAAMSKVGKAILKKFGYVDVLVNAAGTNAPRRSLQELSHGDYRRMLDTNLDGAYYCAQAFLPSMRARRAGTIVNIVSDAGKQASPKAGPAYVMSKFGLAGLTQAINAEERGNGIRACAIFPGDIDTPLLNLRPQPPAADARQRMLQAGDVARCALLAITLPPRAVVEEILIRPR